VMGSNPSKVKGGRNPVEKVSWNGAKAFVGKLSAQTGKEYRLLSESEWEYMARAGSTTLFHWGGEIDSSKARYETREPVPVGSYSANAFGVYDTAGNVWEWVEDCYTNGYEGAPSDGSAWTSTKDVSSNGLSCKDHMTRGGGYNSDFFDLRSASRVGGRKAGFRIARTLSQ
jgi:formylglycine-generating enzyme required for sulfatase activity